MANTIHAFDFLESPPTAALPVCVLFGSEAFLKRLAKQTLREMVLGKGAEVPFATFEGESAEWRDVADEVATMSLFGGGRKRLVIVEDADPFVKSYRTQLEDYLEHPRRSGILVLEVGTWASNTLLYKAVDKNGLQVDCRLPQKTVGRRTEMDEGRLCKWLVSWTKSQHQAKLEIAAAKLLLEFVEGDLGLVDQDLAKLALLAGAEGKITPELVHEVIGGFRTKTIWELIDAAADGDAREALRQLDRALQSGEPLALFGQISWSLRRYAVATRIYQRTERRGERMTLRDALEQAGFRPWPAQALPNAERQLKQLGRDRAGQLLKWLLEADLAMKGSHSTPDRARFVLEKLFLRLAKRTPASAKRVVANE